MGSHLGTRPTRNSKAIVPVNLFDKEVIRGKVAQNTNRGDILFSTEYGFNETLESIAASPTSYALQISVEKHNGSYYMVVGQAGGPCIITYRLIDGLWIMQKPPTQRVISSAYGVSLKSYNGKLYLAVAHYVAPFVTIFYWAGDEWQAIGDITDNPGSNGRSASLTIFNGKLYLAVAHVSAPFITTYVKSTVDESWTKLAQPTVLPVTTGNGAALTAFDGEMFLAVACTGNPYIRTYKFNTVNDTWDALPNPPTIPPSSGNGAQFNTINGKLYLSVAHSTSPYNRHYEYDKANSTWTNLPTVTGTAIPGTTAYSSLLFEVSEQLYSTTTCGVEPFVKTAKLVDNTWVACNDPAATITHNYNLTSQVSYFCERFEVDGEIYLAISLQYQPHFKLYRWNKLLEQWEDNGLVDPFCSPTGTGVSPDMAIFNGTTYLAIGHGSSPFLTIYKHENGKFNVMKRPASIPPGQCSGATFVEFNGVLYIVVACSGTGSFRMYALNGEIWELIDPPTSNLPSGNGVFACAKVFNSELIITVVTTQTPFVSSYKWNSTVGWTSIARPSSIPASAAIDASMCEYNGKLHLAICYTNAPRLSTYILTDGVWADSLCDYLIPSAAYGVDLEEHNGEFFLVLGHASTLVSFFKWNGSNSLWERQVADTPAIKAAPVLKLDLYSDDADFYVVYTFSSSTSFNRIQVMKRLNGTWQSIFISPIIDVTTYGVKMFRSGATLYLLVGIALAPFFKMYALDDTIEPVWSKAIPNHGTQIAIAKESGTAGSIIDLYVEKG